MARPDKDILEEREAFVNTIFECAKKPSLFSKIFLGLELFPYNAEYADCTDRFIVYRSGRQAGKTTTTAVKAIHFAFFAPTLLDTVEKECTILIAAPTQNQSAIMFNRIRQLIEGSEFLKGYIVRNTQSEIWVSFLDGSGVSRIVTRATGETGITLRGYSPHIIIADECSFIKTSILRAFLPSGLATKARVWLTSTPFAKNSYFYEACMNSRPRKADGLWREFHVSSLRSPLVQDNQVFVDEVKNLAQEEYVMEVEGEFLDIGDALIPNSLLMEAISDAKTPDDVRYVIGVDVARSGRDETVFVVLAIDKNDVCYIVETYSEAQSNLVDVVGRMGEYYRKYRAETIYVDETGLGGGVVDLGRKQDLPIRGVMWSLQEKAKMYSDLRVLFENHRVKIKNIDKMIYQLGYLKREYTESGQLKIKSEVHDDYPSALVLACRAVSSGDNWHVMDIGKNIQKAIFG